MGRLTDEQLQSLHRFYGERMSSESKLLEDTFNALDELIALRELREELKEKANGN
jgi:hypothetical protein